MPTKKSVPAEEATEVKDIVAEEKAAPAPEQKAAPAAKKKAAPKKTAAKEVKEEVKNSEQ